MSGNEELDFKTPVLPENPRKIDVLSCELVLGITKARISFVPEVLNKRDFLGDILGSMGAKLQNL